MNGSGGYTNGYRDEGSQNSYGREENDRYAFIDGTARGEGRERRPGGYGGFTDSQSDYHRPVAQAVSRPANLDRSRANRRSGDRNWSHSRSRSRAGGNQRIEDVLMEIRSDWDFMSEGSCVPAQVALKLLDSSSLGLASRYEHFRQTSQELQSALKAIVNEHHQGFNSSIGTFHKIQSSIHSSQTRVRQLKVSLIEAKSDLSTTKPELKELSTTSQSYDEMLQVLNTIEQLQAVPEKLEARISEKRFLTAVDVLQEAMRLIRRSEMENIGALGDLRVYLSNQEHHLIDILIEELHNHLYLKSPYCENSFRAVVPSSNYNNNEAKSISNLESRRVRMYEYLDKLDIKTPMTDNPSRNPEVDTFQYIHLILETLSRMGRLNIAIDRIEQRLPVELFKVVEKANVEPEDMKQKSKQGTSDRAVLDGLLALLYARLEAVAHGHRVVHEVVTGIVKREGLRDGDRLTGGFKGLWKLYQSEIRSLLHDYLATNANVGYRGVTGGTEAAPSSQRSSRDKGKKIFSLLSMNNKSMELTTEKQELEAILKQSVPGLVSDVRRSEALAAEDGSAPYDRSATGHKLLVQPSIFNMGILLPPALTFLTRLKDVVPSGSDIVTSTLTSFLDDFLVNVFHPQLDETLVELCSQIFIELEAFQQDPQWSSKSQKPLFLGTTKFYDLITIFCSMLDNLPHDQALSQLIVTQMENYHDRCFGWLKSLICRPQPNPDDGRTLKAAAAFGELPDIQDIVLALSNAQTEEAQTLIVKETELLISRASNSPIQPIDIVASRKHIAQLCLLHNSMKWLASKLTQLRHISDRATDSSGAAPGRIQYRRRWTMLTLAEPRSDDGAVYLPLNPESAIFFDRVVNSYHGLAASVLRMVHLEIRCRILHGVHEAMSGTHELDQLLNEPDPRILALNEDIISFDEEIGSHLLQAQHAFVTNGLGYFLDRVLVNESVRIKSMNENGCGRMQLNVLVLQQNLRNVEPKALLFQSARFFDLFSAGPDAVVTQAVERGGKQLGLSYEEVKAVIVLCYSEAINSSGRETSIQAQRNLEDHLSQLTEQLWRA